MAVSDEEGKKFLGLLGPERFKTPGKVSPGLGGKCAHEGKG